MELYDAFAVNTTLDTSNVMMRVLKVLMGKRNWLMVQPWAGR